MPLSRSLWSWCSPETPAPTTTASNAIGFRVRTGMSTFDKTRLATLHEVMADHVARGNAGGLAWLAARDDQVEVGVAGVLTRGEQRPVVRDSIFRIASMTKPMAAVGALILI